MSAQLSGDWYNQLGSKVTLTADATGGLSGEYNSAVGQAEDVYVLTGRFDVAPPAGNGTSVGWVVTFRNDELNANSTSTWSGQYFDGENERILTQWLLTRSTEPSAIWDSTNVGHDTFTRNEPTTAEIAKARAFTIGSPHPEDIIAMLRK